MKNEQREKKNCQSLTASGFMQAGGDSRKIPVREYRSVEKKNATTLRIPSGMRPAIKGCIPIGMQVPRMDTFSTERYSLTGIWVFNITF